MGKRAERLRLKGEIGKTYISQQHLLLRPWYLFRMILGDGHMRINLWFLLIIRLHSFKTAQTLHWPVACELAVPEVKLQHLNCLEVCPIAATYKSFLKNNYQTKLAHKHLRNADSTVNEYITCLASHVLALPSDKEKKINPLSSLNPFLSPKRRLETNFFLRCYQSKSSVTRISFTSTRHHKFTFDNSTSPLIIRFSN